MDYLIVIALLCMPSVSRSFNKTNGDAAVECQQNLIRCVQDDVSTEYKVSLEHCILKQKVRK